VTRSTTPTPTQPTLAQGPKVAGSNIVDDEDQGDELGTDEEDE
jgi:hypothetical protein